jgi:hypothetical protein
MRAPSVVAPGVFGEDRPQVPSAEDQHPAGDPPGRCARTFSASALARGLRGGICTAWMPALARAAPKDAVCCPARPRGRNRTPAARSPRSTGRLRSAGWSTTRPGARSPRGWARSGNRPPGRTGTTGAGGSPRGPRGSSRRPAGPRRGRAGTAARPDRCAGWEPTGSAASCGPGRSSDTKDRRVQVTRTYRLRGISEQDNASVGLQVLRFWKRKGYEITDPKGVGTSRPDISGADPRRRFPGISGLECQRLAVDRHNLTMHLAQWHATTWWLTWQNLGMTC